MDLAEQLNTIQLKQDVLNVCQWVGTDKQRFGELMQLVLNGTLRQQQKGAWVMTTICDLFPSLAEPYLGKMLGKLVVEGLHQGLYRSLIRVMQTCELPKQLHGRIIDTMFQIALAPKRSIAEHAFSLQVAARMVKTYPDLKPEFELVMAEVLEIDSSAAVKSTVRSIRKKLG